MPLKIIEYIIVTSDRIQTTTREVIDMHASRESASPVFMKAIDIGIEDLISAKIEKGYQPYGFLEVRGEHQYTTYTQAMVKYSKDTVV